MVTKPYTSKEEQTMNKVYTIFSELLKLCPRYHFDKAVEQYHGDRYVKTFTTWQQFMAILYSQITQKDSLRDIVTGLSAHAARWYHLGLTGIHKSTLSDANAKRDYRMFEGLFYHLLARCKNLTPKHKFRFKNPLYTIDASTIDLCLSVFPWAKFRTTKGAIKLHCLYDHSGALPTFLTVTDGKRHDVRVVKDNTFPLSPDSIVSVDKAYIDYTWLNSLDEQGVWFVTRAKTNIDYAVVGQHPISNKRVLSDERISLQGQLTKAKYSKELRLIRYYDEERQKTADFPYEQFQARSNDDCPDLQVPLADRVVFQMDQTEPQDQVVSGYQQERCDDSNLGGNVLLSASDLYQVPDKIQLLVAATQSRYSRNAF